LRGNVTGGNYPPPPIIELLLKVLGFFQLCGIVLAMMGSSVFRIVGMSYVPAWYPSIEKNAVPIAIGLYLVLPQVLNSYTVSGAFEIVLNDSILIFSKLTTGRLPQVADLVNPLMDAGLVFKS
jgi:selT/selW/selH-like putative selenoprotein